MAAEKEKRRFKDELARLRAKQEKAVDKELDTLSSAVRKARETIRSIETRLRRRRVDPKSLAAARSSVEDVAARMETNGDLRRDTGNSYAGKQANEEDIRPGARLFVKSLGTEGVVDSSLKNGKVLVHIGKIATRVRLQDLLTATNRQSGGPTDRSPMTTLQPLSTDSQKPLKLQENTLDVRGMTSQEGVEATDVFLDRAMRDEIDMVFIIHGYGTGALRQAVREYLKESRYIKDFWPGEKEHGGDGVTIAALS